jgi:hypothetical protein
MIVTWDFSTFGMIIIKKRVGEKTDKKFWMAGCAWKGNPPARVSPLFGVAENSPL